MIDGKKEEDKEIEEVRFNLGDQQLQQLGSLLDSANTNRVKRNLVGWFFDLKGIKLKIITKINETIRKELKQKERSILFLFNKIDDSYVSSVEPEVKKINNNARVFLDKHLEEYEIRLMDLLDERSFLIPAKISKVGLFGQHSQGEIKGTTRRDPDERKRE